MSMTRSIIANTQRKVTIHNLRLSQDAALANVLNYSGRTGFIVNNNFTNGDLLYTDRTNMFAAHMAYRLNGAVQIRTPQDDVRIYQSQTTSSRPNDLAFLNSTKQYMTFEVAESCIVYVLSSVWKDVDPNFLGWGWEKMANNGWPVTVNGVDAWSVSDVENLFPPAFRDMNAASPPFYVTRRQEASGIMAMMPTYRKFIELGGNYAVSVNIPVPGKTKTGADNIVPNESPGGFADNYVVCVIPLR